MSNIVVHIFSNEPKLFSAWAALASTLSSTVCWNEHSSFVADAFVPPSGPETEVEGKVFEICAGLVEISPERDVTLETCRQVQELDMVRKIEKKEGVELVIQPYSLYLQHRTPGLAVFDMDSTLIQQEVIDELARAVGKYDQVAKITEAAMRGELDFEQSLQARVAQLKGVKTDIWEQLKRDIITLSPGAESLVKVLKRLGWKTAVLSGGFTPLAFWLRDRLGLDYAYANQLSTDGQGLTGRLVADAPIIHATAKRELLVQLAMENKIPLANTIAVGDGSNDLLMMGVAGLGIAYNAKPKVQTAAPARLNSASLLDVVYLLGYRRSQIDEILGSD